MPSTTSRTSRSGHIGNNGVQTHTNDTFVLAKGLVLFSSSQGERGNIRSSFAYPEER